MELPIHLHANLSDFFLLQSNAQNGVIPTFGFAACINSSIWPNLHKQELQLKIVVTGNAIPSNRIAITLKRRARCHVNYTSEKNL